MLLIAPACERRADLDPIAVAEDRRLADAPALAAALVDADPARRARAALAFGRIQDPAAVGGLLAALDDETKAVRRAAIFALGQLGLADGATALPAAVAACESRLDGDDPELVALAVEALGKLAPVDLESRLAPLSGHPSSEVRTALAHALFRRRFVPTWRGEADEPPALGVVAQAWLARALRDESLDVRRAAAHACSRFGEAVALEALAGALERDTDELVRLWSARALARRDPAAPGDSPAAALARAANDPSPRVRVEAFAGLAAHDARGRIPPAAATDESFHVRAAWAAAQALPGTPGQQTLAALERLLDDPSPTVRAAAMSALAARLGDELLPTLRSWLDRDEAADRLAAIEAASGLGAAAVELLLAIEADDVPTRVARLDALAALDAGPERVDPLIAEALAADDLALRGTAIERIDAGRPALRAARLVDAYDASPGPAWIELRESVLDALADLIDEDQALLTLVRRAASSDPAESVRSRASRMLRDRGIAPPVSTVPPRPASRLVRVAAAADRSRPRVALETERGTLTLELFAEDAPLHVALFLELVDDGYYDGLGWHRVVSNFVIQGGDPRGDGWGGAGTTLRDEINRHPYRRGSVGMPKAGKDTGGGQLFLTHIPTPHLDGNYTVFGQVVDGERVIERIDRGDRIVRARRLPAVPPRP